MERMKLKKVARSGKKHDVPVKWIGPGLYEIKEPNTIKKEHEEHWRVLHLREKVHFIQKSVR